MIEELIKNRLEFLNASSFLLENESEHHKGHAGNTGGGHFNISIVSEKFEGKSRMERHQMIYDSLKDFFPEKIHALSIKAVAPSDNIKN
jgi:BolA protein